MFNVRAPPDGVSAVNAVRAVGVVSAVCMDTSWRLANSQGGGQKRPPHPLSPFKPWQQQWQHQTAAETKKQNSEKQRAKQLFSWKPSRQ